MLNQCIFQGRVAGKPAYNSRQENVKVCNFRLAVQRDFKDKSGNLKADYINCSAFGKNAEIVDKYCPKGQMIVVKGSYRNGTPYNDSEGVRRYPSYVVVEKIYFTYSKSLNEEDTEDEEQVELVQMGDIPF